MTQSYYDQATNIWQMIEGLSPVVIRPKCLLIFYGIMYGIKNHGFRKAVHKLLYFAWSLKLLDFTILHLILKKDERFFYLGPFKNRFLNFQLNDNPTSVLFPNKLVGVQNFTIPSKLLHLVNRPCICNIRKGNLEMYLSSERHFVIFLKQFFQYTGIKVLCKLVNCSAIMCGLLHLRYFEQLSTNELSMYLGPLFLVGNNSLIKQVETSRILHLSPQEVFDQTSKPRK